MIVVVIALNIGHRRRDSTMILFLVAIPRHSRDSIVRLKAYTALQHQGDLVSFDVAAAAAGTKSKGTSSVADDIQEEDEAVWQASAAALYPTTTIVPDDTRHVCTMIISRHVLSKWRSSSTRYRSKMPAQFVPSYGHSMLMPRVPSTRSALRFLHSVPRSHSSKWYGHSKMSMQCVRSNRRSIHSHRLLLPGNHLL